MGGRKTESGIPKYQQIAADIAYKIVDGTYQEGRKIYARSSIGSQYSVSSETARRAMCILADWDVVEVEKNSGVVIKSLDNARNFLQQQEQTKSIQNLKRNILDNVERQQQETKELYGYLTELIKQIECYRATNPFIPYELVIKEDTPYLDRTVGEVNLWQETFATVIAIRRNGTLMMSPGPKAVFRLNDIFYYTGDDECPERVRKFMYPKQADDK
ncbi:MULTISPECIES: GntR family transcriptional regulator [Sellimonas]|uniref:GntR family transcriptional regulator n=1 Tax=Sellimonas caecigallum TaxID=2592333 RepID=A0ABS7L6Z3_9FIRM|nr:MULTISPECIES: GntR family transcriptional regulator [Sellimonas]MBY0758815.1 GntR family transcriptional regulator [Sellimonas caecigallum]